MRMKRNRFLRTLLIFVIMFSFALSVPVASGQRRHRRYRNPEAGKKKAAKRIGVGTAIGAGAGALIGGRKGALIGAGAGTAYHYHKKRQYRRRHRRP